MINKKPTSMTYKAAGVDIEQANHLVKSIASMAKSTQRHGVLNGIGGFGALFEVPVDRYHRPVLVSGTDGVGTKLKLAIDMNKHDTIGIDLVAMCVNDILTLGAEPLYFLDYFATGKLCVSQAEAIVSGIAQGCRLADIALIGGETAEMPDLYQKSDYDLAGFCVGVVEKDKIIDGSGIQEGDQLVALASSGPHANGYSLIRNIIAAGAHSLSEEIAGSCLGDILLTPTTIYTRTLMHLYQSFDLHGMVHVTGGGLLENLPRVLPETLCAKINSQSWQWPPIFQWLQEQGNVATEEMLRTFNVGVGMVVVLDKHDVPAVLAACQQLQQEAWHLGEIQKACDAQQVVFR